MPSQPTAFRRARSALSVCSSILLLVVSATAARAQTETGQIAGTVRDPAGAVVAAATVTVRSTTTGLERTTTSTSAGVYAVPNLQPGDYEVRVDAPGFAGVTRTVAVTAGDRTGLDVDLAVAGSANAADVVATEQGIQPNTENQQVSTTIDEKLIKELPNLNRNLYAIVRLSPNVSDTGAGGRGVAVAINGQRASSVNILLDGSDNNDAFLSGPGQKVPLDAVQEVNIITSNFSAEFGRAGGGIVNVVTKSGANEYHGTVYEFNRASALASRDFSTNAIVLGNDPRPKKGVYAKNQFGASVGGPIVKDKLLFFTNVEWARTRSGTTVEFWVPTPELVAASAPETQTHFAGQELIAPASGRVLRVSDILGYLKNIGVHHVHRGPFAALGPAFPAFERVLAEVPVDTGAGRPSNVFLIVNRVDWNVSDKTSVYARYAFQNNDVFQTRRPTAYSGYGAGFSDVNSNVLVSATHTFGDRLVAQTKFAYMRLDATSPAGEKPIHALIQPDSFAGLGAGLNVDFPGLYAGTLGGPQTLSHLYEDVSYTFGRHQLRFGGSFDRILDQRTKGIAQTGVQGLGWGPKSSLDNFVLGRSIWFTVAIDQKGRYPGEEAELPFTQPSFTRENTFLEYALYVTDAWKPRPRLTINAGLRYEYFGVQHNRDRSLDSNFYLGEGATLAEQIHSGRVMRAEESPISALVEPDRNNFAPRVGVAWDVFGDGKTALRGGYGISYERNFGEVTYNIIFNPPGYGVATLYSGEVDLDYFPLYTDNLGPFSGTGTHLVPKSDALALRTDLHTAFAHTWSVSAEHQLFGNTLVGVDYTGSKGTALYDVNDVNRPLSGAVYLGIPGPGQEGWDSVNNYEARLNRQYNAINLVGNGGSSIYHAMVVRVASRGLARSGLHLDASYTWAHAIDTLSDTFSETQAHLGYTDAFDPDAERGSAAYDVRHRLVLSGVWDVPFAKYSDGWERGALDGWSFSFAYTAETGTPFNVYDCTGGWFGYCPRVALTAPVAKTGPGDPPPVDAAHDPFYAYAANTNVYIDLLPLWRSGSVGSYVNPLTTQLLQAWTGEPDYVDSDYGPYPANTAGRNIFRGPGAWNLDAAILKHVELTEKVRLELRFEFFNLFNHANLYVEDTYIDGATFVNAHREGNRNVQMGVKLIF